MTKTLSARSGGPVTDAVAPLDVVRAHPLCAETPTSVLPLAVTPRESVYVRSNFETPIAHGAWTLAVGGAVRAPFTLSLADIAALPMHTVLATMECAGNWRLGMDPVPTGEPWKYGAVSTTRWRGVSLAALLDRAGVHDDALEVVAVGADAGPCDDAEGEVRFERALPLEVARHPDTLVAMHMDGVPLTAHHGAPLRLLVPNWYGMASVKWLTALDVRTTPFTGYFQSKRYVYDVNGTTTPVTRALVKSMIVLPALHAETAADTVVRGWAWSGSGAIIRVDVAVNDQWHRATVGRAASAYAWTPFELSVSLPPGEVTLRSRATDASGAVQPERIAWNALGYGNNAIRPHTVRAVSGECSDGQS
ncbi:sulfite oxidase [Gemmatimonas sp.]|uniref:sulfite oxidase n=1 Tax=Gemmatimonas sp. TaxID=1962908 RepID=UPI0037C15A7F